MNSPEHLAKLMVEAAKGSPTSRHEIHNRVEWMLCSWDPAHRLELVTKDIRLDKPGLDVELLYVPWYAQIPKNIPSMYATCSYGKQYEELLQTAKNFGRKWYVMVKFCETRFTQSELKVYVNFEHNYNTYRRTWGAVESIETELPEEEESRVDEAA